MLFLRPFYFFEKQPKRSIKYNNKNQTMIENLVASYNLFYQLCNKKY